MNQVTDLINLKEKIGEEDASKRLGKARSNCEGGSGNSSTDVEVSLS
jgi:hypothetical protein